MENCFNPKEVHVLAKVIDEACVKLGIADPMTKGNIAALVLNHAAQDERDFDTLLSVALNGRVIARAA